MNRLLVCLLLVGGVGCEHYTSKAALEYTNGNKCIQREDWAGAIGSFTRAIEIAPEFAAAYYFRGIVYEELGEFEKATADYSKVVQLDPERVVAYEKRSHCYERAGEFGKAIADYDRVLDLNDADRKVQEAHKSHMRHVKTRADPIPRDLKVEYQEIALVFRNRGVAYSQQKKYDSAIDDFTAAIRLGGAARSSGKSPALADVYYQAGIAFQMLQKHDSAISDFNSAISLKHNYAEAHQARGVSHEILGDKAKAAADFARAKELGYEPEDE